jgi:hypothetical protein
MSVADNMPLGMPQIVPMPMGNGTVRRWELIDDWQYKMDNITIFIRGGFVFDGASIPRVFTSIYNPTGYLLIAALIHDYCYKWGFYIEMLGDQLVTVSVSRTKADLMFKRIGNIEYPNHKGKTWVAYKALKMGGWVAWNGHRKNE